MARVLGNMYLTDFSEIMTMPGAGAHKCNAYFDGMPWKLVSTSGIPYCSTSL